MLESDMKVRRHELLKYPVSIWFKITNYYYILYEIILLYEQEKRYEDIT